MTRVAAIGEAMIELSIEGNLAAVGVAGDTLNTAIYLKRMAPGIDVDFITCLGDDPFSNQIMSFIQSQDIGTEKIARLEGSSPGLYAISTTDAGERSFTYWRGESAARRMFEPNGKLELDVLKGYDLIYLSGISLAILPHSVRMSLLEWLNKAPVQLAYDSNFRPKLWESQAVAQSVTSAFWERADICLPSVDDEMALFECSESEVIKRFDSLNTKGAVKRGADGPISLGCSINQLYAPAPFVVDTTAAGDSFNGGYLASLMQSKPQSEALLAGHNLAVEVVQHKGAIIPRTGAG